MASGRRSLPVSSVQVRRRQSRRGEPEALTRPSYEEAQMRVMRVMASMVLLLVIGGAPLRAEQPGTVEPNAGKWKTWLITSGAELRTVPPPDGRVTERELEELVRTATKRDRAALDRIVYWDTGAP